MKDPEDKIINNEEETSDVQIPESPAKDDKKESRKSEIKKLKADLEAAKEVISKENMKNAELTDRFMRLAAEFDNYKKRTAKELEGRYQDARYDTVKYFLGIADNFERALKTPVPEECRQYISGVEMIYDQLMKQLKDLGVTEIDALGKTFDPNLHNAVLHVDDETKGENEIVEVFEKGYMLGDKVLRYSTVKVAN